MELFRPLTDDLVSPVFELLCAIGAIVALSRAGGLQQGAIR